MSRIPPALSRLQSLSNKIHDFQYFEIVEEELSRFYAHGVTECERLTHQKKSKADLIHRFSVNGHTRTAFISVPLDPFVDFNNQKIIDEALIAAPYCANLDFELIRQDQVHWKDVKLSDRESLGQPQMVVDRIEATLRASVPAGSAVRLAHAEMYLKNQAILFHNSRNVQGIQDESLYHVLVSVLAEKDKKVSEVQLDLVARSFEKLDLEAQLQWAADACEKQLSAVLPQSGLFDVILTGECLESIFDWVKFQTNLESHFNQVADRQKNKSLCDQKINGDHLTLSTDSSIDFGVASYRFDQFGFGSGRVQLVKNSTVQNYWGDKRYSDYMGVPCVGSFGMCVVEPGKMSLSEILSNRDRRPVYVVHQFSSFHPDPITGEWSAEIRLADEYQGGKWTGAIRGGSVTCSMPKALGDMWLSNDLIQRQKYLGPKYIRFNDLVVSGRTEPG